MLPIGTVSTIIGGIEMVRLYGTLMLALLLAGCQENATPTRARELPLPSVQPSESATMVPTPSAFRTPEALPTPTYQPSPTPIASPQIEKKTLKGIVSSKQLSPELVKALEPLPIELELEAQNTEFAYSRRQAVFINQPFAIDVPVGVQLQVSLKLPETPCTEQGAFFKPTLIAITTERLELSLQHWVFDADLDMIEKATFHGRVFDDKNKPLDGVIITTKSLYPPVSYGAEIRTVKGAYVLQNVPHGIQMEITAAKIGYMTRKQVVEVKNNRFCDPKVNTYDFVMNEGPFSKGTGSIQNALINHAWP